MLLLHKMKRRVHAYIFFNMSLGFLSGLHIFALQIKSNPNDFETRAFCCCANADCLN